MSKGKCLQSYLPCEQRFVYVTGPSHLKGSSARFFSGSSLRYSRKERLGKSEVAEALPNGREMVIKLPCMKKEDATFFAKKEKASSAKEGAVRRI